MNWTPIDVALLACSALFFGAAVLFILDDVLDFVRTRSLHGSPNVSGRSPNTASSADGKGFSEQRSIASVGEENHVRAERKPLTQLRSFMRSGEGR